MVHSGCPMPLFSFQGAVLLAHSQIPLNLRVLLAFISSPGLWWPSCYCEFIVLATWFCSGLKLYFPASPPSERTSVLSYFLLSWQLPSFSSLLVHSQASHRSLILIFADEFNSDLTLQSWQIWWCLGYHHSIHCLLRWFGRSSRCGWCPFAHWKT